MQNLQPVECMAVKIIQSESCSFFCDKICRCLWVLVFLVFFFFCNKMNFKIWRPLEVGKREKRPAQKESNCNNVCRVCQVNLKLTYGKCVAKACGNIFKPSARKEIFRVVLSGSLKSFGITVIASYIDRSWPALPVHVVTQAFQTHNSRNRPNINDL